MKTNICALGLIVALTSGSIIASAVPAQQQAKPKAAAPTATIKSAQPATKVQQGILDTSYKEVSPLSLLDKPDGWVGEKVSFQAGFVSFSPYALDYDKAMRSSKDFIAFLIKRPDVTHHVIPMSEIKLIYPRKKSDSVMDLESGDKVLVKGKVFSSALGDPWVDVDELVLLQKSPENAKKKKKNVDLE